MADSNKVKVALEIFGDTYTVQADDDAVYMHEMAYYVDEILADIQKKNVYLSRTQVAVFGALSIADRYHKLQKDYEELLKLLTDEETSTPIEMAIDPNFRRRRKRGQKE